MFVAYSRDKICKEVGTSRQLFIDNDVVAVVKNITRRYHSPEKHPQNPVIQKDQSWEGIPYFRTSTYNVVHDPTDGMYKCWYEDFVKCFGITKEDAFPTSRICFAHSRDGITWEKPSLGRKIINGHDTNICIDRSPNEMVSCPSVLLDPRDKANAQRYKMMYFLRSRNKGPSRSTPFGSHNAGLHMSFSPDGIDWTEYKQNPVFPSWGSDVEILTFDPIDNKYILFGRYGGQSGGSEHPDFDGWFAPVWPIQPDGIWDTRRRIYRTESRDCLTWDEPVLAFEPGEMDNLDDGHYGFCSWRIDEMHLGLLSVLHGVDNTVDMYLHISRDGHNWTRLLDHRPFITRGPAGSYDQFAIECPTQPVEVDNEIRFYYGGSNVHHDWWIYGKSEGLDVHEAHDPQIAEHGHHLCLATLRRDGYVSLDATAREGYVHTKPVFSPAPALYINGRCQRNGYIQVEVMDAWGNVWDGFSQDDCVTFDGNNVHHQVQWSGPKAFSDIPGRITLKFYLRNAELYGFHYGDR